MELYKVLVKINKMVYFSLTTALAGVAASLGMFGRPWVCPGSGQTEARVPEESSTAGLGAGPRSADCNCTCHSHGGQWRRAGG